MPPKIVYVEGLIGAGKSTLLRTISDVFPKSKVMVIYEPVHKWEESGVLKLFYSDPKRWAYTFQTYVCVTRVQAIHDAIRILSKCEYDALEYIFVERSMFSDKYFFMNNLWKTGDVNENEIKLYDEWWSMWKRTLPDEFSKTYSFLYIKPSMDMVMTRVRKRSRDGEESVNVEYQSHLQNEHETFFPLPRRLIRTPSPETGNIDSAKHNFQLHSGRTYNGERYVLLESDDNVNSPALVTAIINVFRYIS
jgi:deoxyadenosine/deoxycytidine kinase